MTRTFLLLLCILQCPGRFQSSPVVPASVVKLWASVFGGEIKSITAKYSGAQLLQKGSDRAFIGNISHFKVESERNKYKEQSVTVQKIDGIKLVKKLAENMEQMFHKKAEAIKVSECVGLVEAAEEAHLNHQEDPELQFEYFNAVLINEQDEEGERVGEELMVEPNQHFNNLSVNLSLSVVQVPTNMYNQDSALVNGVFWSEALNRVFVQNFRKDPALMWQYFGSAKGFFRQYPGMKWTAEEHGVLEFDCRNRKWYIQAATSPKDVVVLLDVSGSMKGLRLTIARQTVSSILDTLGDDDFFNVIAYNEQLHYVEPCMNGSLVQADSSKKDHFRHRLEKLSAKGIGMLDLALKEAFELLDNFNQTGRGSVCSQAIMLVTDGAVETYEAVFAEYNWPERKVRIFPYLIGRESVFAENLKWMACANKGYFTQISTLADVQENVMKYLHVLSRPKVMDHEHDMVWTEAYMDNTLRDAYGPVLMTTVAMPVFSSKNETSDQGVLLGVVGTDVPVSEILRAVPKFKLGIHGYAFAITNNGFVLTHPDLRPLYEDSRRSRSKRRSGHHSVDLSELELEDTEDELRNAMVNRETGVFSMSVKKSVDKGKRVLVLHHHYYYTHIRGTPFSVAVTLSGGHGERLFRGNISILEGLQDLEHPDVLLAEGWTYCSTEDHPEHLTLTQADAIRLFYEGEADVTCDEDLVRELVFDAAVTAPLEAYWTSLSLNKSENTDGGLEMAFLSTRTGLSRLGLFLTPDLLSSQDVLSADDKESAFSLDPFPLWYKRSAEQLPGTFLYSLPFSTGSENRNVVLASSAIHLSDDRESPIAAVVGVQMKLAFFQRKFWTACRQCATLDRRCSVSCDSEDISCFLIDNNGFILVSEDPLQTGLFFGEVEGSVMNRLVSMGSFKRVELYDFQAVCRIYTQSSDTAHTLTHPFFAVFAALRWLLTEILLFLLEFSVLRCWSSGAMAHSGRVRYVSCGKEYPAFVSERTIKETVGSIDCEDCVKSFVIQQIPSSNLFIIVTDNTCDCSRLGTATLQPNDIIYNESVTCERLMLHRKRRRPDTCHAVQQQEEDSLECGVSSGVFASRTATVFLLLFSVFVL